MPAGAVGPREPGAEPARARRPGPVLPLRRWPRWRRRLAARRVLAGTLLALAVVSAVHPPGAGVARVLVARSELAAGRAIAVDDVELRALAPAAVPAGALTDATAALGRRPVGPVRAGETLTDVRLVGPEAAAAAVGAPGAAGVPVRLADAAVAALLRPGTRVDLVGADDTAVGAGAGSAPGVGAGPGGGVLAAGALVLDVLPAAERGGGPVVVLALPGPEAARVAAATLGREVTVTLR